MYLKTKKQPISSTFQIYPGKRKLFAGGKVATVLVGGRSCRCGAACQLGIKAFGYFDHQGTFNALAEHFAAIFIHTVDIAGGVQGVGGAAARAVQACPAILAVGAGVHVAQLEFIPQFGVGNAVPDIAQLVIRVADKLMSGVQVAPGGNGHIFGAGTTAGNALVNAGAMGQVDHVMVEGDGMTGFFTAEHILGQQLILVKQDG